MLCGPPICGCSFQSVSLDLSGSGEPGDPLVLETYEGTVALASDIATPFLGQRIYETTTGRLKVYDGSNWVIYGGAWPGFSAYAAAAQSMPDAASTPVTGLTEVYDTDAIYNTGTGIATIPVGLGGDWVFSGEGWWAGNLAGARFLIIAVTSNASITGEADQATAIDGPAAVYSAPRQLASDTFRLEAGAVINFYGFQNSGGAVNFTARKLRGRMVRHIPSLT